MRAELSVVIPTLNAAEALPGCLAALTEGLQAGLIRELVISDGGSEDATRDIADAAGAVLLAGPPSRGGQLRRGAGTAEGEWLLFLHADTRLADGWAAAVRAQMKAGRPGYFKLGFDVAGLAPALVSGWANLRSRLFHLPYGDQALLVSRTDYDAAGGYPDIPIMEDVALARRLGGRLEAMPLRVSTSAARYRRDGWLRRGERQPDPLAALSGRHPPREVACPLPRTRRAGLRGEQQWTVPISFTRIFWRASRPVTCRMGVRRTRRCRMRRRQRFFAPSA